MNCGYLYNIKIFCYCCVLFSQFKYLRAVTIKNMATRDFGHQKDRHGDAATDSSYTMSKR